MLGAWSRDATPKLVESCRGLRLRVVDGAQCVRGSLGPSAHAVVVKGALFPGIFGGMPYIRERIAADWGAVSAFQCCRCRIIVRSAEDDGDMV